MTLITLIIMAIVIWTYCDWKDAANKEKKRRHQQELLEARGFNRKPISPIPYNLRKKRWEKYFYDYTSTPTTSKVKKENSDNEAGYSNSDL